MNNQLQIAVDPLVMCINSLQLDIAIDRKQEKPFRELLNRAVFHAARVSFPNGKPTWEET